MAVVEFGPLYGPAQTVAASHIRSPTTPQVRTQRQVWEHTPVRRIAAPDALALLVVIMAAIPTVGRPASLQREADEDDAHANRRLSIPQRITGRWQVSGRSDSNWIETVRFDLDYVKNWSMLREPQIVWRTIRSFGARKRAC